MKGDACGVVGKQRVQLRRDLGLAKDFLFRRQNGEESGFVPSGVDLLLVIVGREEDYDPTCVLSNVLSNEYLRIYALLILGSFSSSNKQQRQQP